MMLRHYFICSTLVFYLYSPLQAQVKFEQEDRISTEEVPSQALEFVKNFQFDRKVKWYREQGLDKTSLEAKTNFRGKRYSIEFDDHGSIEDIEIKMKWTEVPEHARQKISTYFSQNYSRHRVKKIQIQYSGSESKLLAFFKEPLNGSYPKVHYEIVVKGKRSGKYQMEELLFAASGAMVKKSTILLNNADNLEF